MPVRIMKTLVVARPVAILGIKSNRGTAGSQRGRRPKRWLVLDVEELWRGENDGHEVSRGDAA